MIAHRGVTVACSGSSALCSRLRGNASARALGNKRRDVKISSSSQGNLVQQTEAALNLLRSAAVKKDVSPEAVEEAMLQVESTVTEPALGKILHLTLVGMRHQPNCRCVKSLYHM